MSVIRIASESLEFPGETIQFSSWEACTSEMKPPHWVPTISVVRPRFPHETDPWSFVMRPLRIRHETPNQIPQIPSWDPSVSVMRPFRFRHETDPWKFNLTPLRLCTISVMRPFCFRHETGRWNFVWNPWKFRDETHENPSWNIEIRSLKFRRIPSATLEFRRETVQFPSWETFAPHWDRTNFRHDTPERPPKFRYTHTPKSLQCLRLRAISNQNARHDPCPGTDLAKPLTPLETLALTSLDQTIVV